MRIATWISYALQIEVLVGSRSPLRQLTRDRLRLSRSVAREKMRPIVISPLPPMIKANVRAAPIEAPSDQYPRHTMAAGCYAGDRARFQQSPRPEAMERALSR